MHKHIGFSEWEQPFSATTSWTLLFRWRRRKWWVFPQHEERLLRKLFADRSHRTNMTVSRGTWQHVTCRMIPDSPITFFHVIPWRTFHLDIHDIEKLSQTSQMRLRVKSLASLSNKFPPIEAPVENLEFFRQSLARVKATHCRIIEFFVLTWILLTIASSSFIELVHRNEMSNWPRISS